jgi:hypothetical protein
VFAHVLRVPLRAEGLEALSPTTALPTLDLDRSYLRVFLERVRGTAVEMPGVDDWLVEPLGPALVWALAWWCLGAVVTIRRPVP